MKLARGWCRSGMFGTLTGHQSNLSSDIRAGLGKGWKTWGNPYSRTRVWWLVPLFHVSIVVHLYRVWKPEVLPDGTGCSFFYTHYSVEDDMAYLWWSLTLLSWTLMLMFNYETWACHSLNEPCIFMQMYKCLLIPLHPPDIFVLELSPTSTQCTHGAAVKLFYR